MDLRDELSKHSERLWICFLSDQKKPLKTTLGLIDWYNNWLLTKTLELKKDIFLDSQPLLLSTRTHLGKHPIIVLPASDNAPEDLTRAAKILEDFGQEKAWFIVDGRLSQSYANQFEQNLAKQKKLQLCEMNYVA